MFAGAVGVPSVGSRRRARSCRPFNIPATDERRPWTRAATPATTALEAGEFQKAAALFAGFNDAYPGSPLAAQAELNRGKALDGLGDTREAARAYLASFSADTNGPTAASALFELGAALGRLGQTEQACITLTEVGVRFPSDPSTAQAREEMGKLGCT